MVCPLVLVQYVLYLRESQSKCPICPYLLTTMSLQFFVYVYLSFFSLASVSAIFNHAPAAHTHPRGMHPLAAPHACRHHPLLHWHHQCPQLSPPATVPTLIPQMSTPTATIKQLVKEISTLSASLSDSVPKASKDDKIWSVMNSEEFDTLHETFN